MVDPILRVFDGISNFGGEGTSKTSKRDAGRHHKQQTIVSTLMATQTEVIELQTISHTIPVTKEVELPTSSDITPLEISEQYPKLTPLRSVIICIAAAGVTAVHSMCLGILTSGLPAIATDLGISDGLILWPAAIYSLTSGCTFIVIGSIADVVGARLVYLFGCFCLFLTVLACGLAQTAAQIIIFRGLQGAAFPVGYSIGLILEGVFIGSIGWRWGFYLAAICSILVFVSAIWGIPKDSNNLTGAWKRVLFGIDWMGAVSLSASLGLVSYTLAILSGSADSIKQPVTITLLVVGSLLGVFSFWWMSNQEKHGRVSLIPSSVWSNRYFSVASATLLLISLVLNTTEFFFSLLYVESLSSQPRLTVSSFQKVKDITALQAAIRFLPDIIVYTATSFGADAVLHRWSTYSFVLATSAISAISPLFMSLMRPEWSYWYMEFWAMVFLPVGYSSQFGTAVGLGTMSVASSVVTFDSGYSDKTSPAALLEGYRAAFWSCFGAAVLYCVIVAIGLRGVGKIGLKTE
ncbi:hypothetical protein MRB53_042100 [Persea americana]|nr:hypothetical protein MRB53_042100 [Persea americana]